MPEHTYTAPHLISRLPEIRDWCWDNYVECTRLGATWAFKSDEDRIKFVMRWA